LILIFALAAFAVLTLGAIFWATWLEYKTSIRVLEIVDAAMHAGQAPPPELLARLSGAGPARAQTLAQRTLNRVALMLLAIGACCFFAAAFVSTAATEGVLLEVAAISGLASFACLALKMLGRRLRL
jgi:hypothetical protein